MAFDIRIDPLVVEYIDTCDRLTEADRARILAGMVDELGEGAERFLARDPIAHFDDLFWYKFSLMTEALEVRFFWFSCSAEGHVFGVTEVLYVEERADDDS